MVSILCIISALDMLCCQKMNVKSENRFHLRIEKCQMKNVKSEKNFYLQMKRTEMMKVLGRDFFHCVIKDRFPFKSVLLRPEGDRFIKIYKRKEENWYK